MNDNDTPTLDCDGLRAAFGFDAGCCEACHKEATPGNDWAIERPLYRGVLPDGQRFACCCEVLREMEERARGVVG